MEWLALIGVALLLVGLVAIFGPWALAVIAGIALILYVIARNEVYR